MSRVTAAFAQGHGNPPIGLCGLSAQLLEVSGAGITLMSGGNSGPVCASNDPAEALEDLQFTLGQGPCQDAFASGMPVTECDLENAVESRWPQFTPEAIEIGARGVFAFPLNAADKRIGVLTLYQDTPGELTVDQASDSLLVADAVTAALLLSQGGARSGRVADGFSDTGAHRAEVHQASGMISVQLGVGVDEALVRLRAYAYSNSRPIADVAADVVARRFRFGGEQH